MDVGVGAMMVVGVGAGMAVPERHQVTRLLSGDRSSGTGDEVVALV